MIYGSVIGLICILINVYFFFYNFEKGIIWYIIFSFISPVVFDFSYELLCFPILIVATAFCKKGQLCVMRKYDIADFSLILYFLIGIFSTFVSVGKNNVPMNLIGILGILRVVILAVILRKFFQNNFSKKLEFIIGVVTGVNIFACLIQLAFPASVNLFYDLYFKTSLTPLSIVKDLGYFNRLYGTFGTPISLAILFDFSFAFYFYKWYVAKNAALKEFFVMGLVVVLGVLIYSKTFYFSVPIIIVSTMVLLAMKGREINYLSRISILFVCLAVLITVVLSLAKKNEILQYYLNFFTNPLKIFETRYGEEGILSAVKIVVNDNLFFGVGETNLIGEFVGDSAYYSVLHYSGIVGLCFYLITLLYGVVNSYKTNNIIGCVFIIILLICGTASPTFSMIFASITIGVSCRFENDKRKFLLKKGAMKRNENIALRK